MDEISAKKLLKMHSDIDCRCESSFLYRLGHDNILIPELFSEVMECIRCLSDRFYYERMNGEVIKYTYSILFWCRGWLSKDALLDKKLDCLSKKKLTDWIEIIEEALYYLMEGSQESAFFSYEEYLDGRYTGGRG